MGTSGWHRRCRRDLLHLAQPAADLPGDGHPDPVAAEQRAQPLRRLARDTLAIAPHTDGIIFAASLLDSDRRSITAALELLQRLGLNLLGIVATNVPESARSGQSAVGYGYGYGYGTAARAEADPAPRA